MQNWNRPDPLTRDLIHLINARRHDHWDADAAFDTLAELIEQNREDEILTVLAALSVLCVQSVVRSVTTSTSR